MPAIFFFLFIFVFLLSHFFNILLFNDLRKFLCLGLTLFSRMNIFCLFFIVFHSFCTLIPFPFLVFYSHLISLVQISYLTFSCPVWKPFEVAFHSVLMAGYFVFYPKLSLAWGLDGLRGELSWGSGRCYLSFDLTSRISSKVWFGRVLCTKSENSPVSYGDSRSGFA